MCDRGVTRFVEALEEVAAGEGLVCFEFAPDTLTAGGKRVVCEVRVFPLNGGRTVSLLRNISDRKDAERKIAHLAYHDSLTGLPNRLHFQEQIQQGVETALRNDTRLGVLFLDVDRFKSINDTFGHAIGDQLLVTLANRLRNALGLSRRSTSAHSHQSDAERRRRRLRDLAGDILIARMDGDEFTVLLHDLESIEAGYELCRRIIEAVSQPIVLEGLEVVTTFSVGLSVFPDHGNGVESLLQNADAAMYHAKASGRANAQVYSASMNDGAIALAQQEAALRKAIRNGDLSLVYQPLVSVETGCTVGLEALVRWTDPERGLVSPEMFVGIAEESDLILELGRYVVNQACQQIRAWLDAGFKPPQVSINLSSRHFWQGDIVQDIALALDEHSVPVELLGIEMTETAMVQHTERSRATLLELQKLGLSISLDDFGTGNSSLGYLKQFPVDVLKIDRSFVHDISEGSEGSTLIRAIVAMSHGLGIQVVAEGVETSEQMDFLVELGCDFVQGYLLCRPRPPHAIPSVVGERSEPCATKKGAIAC